MGRVEGGLRGGLGHVSHAHQGVCAVGAAQDAGGEHDGQGVGGHAVVRFLLGHPAERGQNMAKKNNTLVSEEFVVHISVVEGLFTWLIYI